MRAVYILLICACSHEAPPTTVTVAPLPTHSANANANANAHADANAHAIASATADPPELENIPQTIARLRSAFRACYNRGLAIDPALAGSVNLTIKLAHDGSVASVAKTGGAGLTSDVETCIQDTIRKTHFEPPDPQQMSSTINLPLRFQSAQP